MKSLADVIAVVNFAPAGAQPGPFGAGVANRERTRPALRVQASTGDTSASRPSRRLPERSRTSKSPAQSHQSDAPAGKRGPAIQEAARKDSKASVPHKPGQHKGLDRKARRRLVRLIAKQASLAQSGVPAESASGIASAPPGPRARQGFASVLIRLVQSAEASPELSSTKSLASSPLGRRPLARAVSSNPRTPAPGKTLIPGVLVLQGQASRTQAGKSPHLAPAPADAKPASPSPDPSGRQPEIVAGSKPMLSEQRVLPQPSPPTADASAKGGPASVMAEAKSAPGSRHGPIPAGDPEARTATTRSASNGPLQARAWTRNASFEVRRPVAGDAGAASTPTGQARSPASSQQVGKSASVLREATSTPSRSAGNAAMSRTTAEQPDPRQVGGSGRVNLPASASAGHVESQVAASAGPASSPATGPQGAPPSLTPASAAGAAPLADQIADSVTLAAGRTGQTIVVRLNPPELGRVRLSLQADGNEIRATLEVENTHTLGALQRETPALIQRLSDSGIQLRRMDLNLTQQDAGSDDSASLPGDGQDAGGGGASASGEGGGGEQVESAAWEVEAATSGRQEAYVGDESINVWM